MSLDLPINPRSLVDQAFERVADAIVLGELKPGERIREALLARRMGVSRGVLREAMQRLEGLKLVSRTSNIGVRVASVSRDDLYELFTLREALEGTAARLAAIHMPDDEVAALGALLDRHEADQAHQGSQGYLQGASDEDFHFLIAEGSRNRRLQALLRDEIHYQLRLYRYRSSLRPGRSKAALLEHRSIHHAIAARDPAQAEAAMRAHLAAARANLDWDSQALGLAEGG